MIKRVGIDGCKNCILYTFRPNNEFRTSDKVVKNVVNTEAEICFHGLGPGEKEERTCLPFQGKAGQNLKDAIIKTGYKVDTVSFTNSVLCRPPENKIDPSMTQPCLHHFKESLSLMPNLKMVCLLGNDGYRAVVGKICTMKNVYLKPFKLEEYGDILFVPIPHPASILYNPTAKAIAYFEDGVLGCFNLLQATKKIEKKKNYISIVTGDKLKIALDILDSQKILAIDTETTSLKPHSAEMICLTFSFEERTGIGIPWRWDKNKQALHYYWDKPERGLIESYLIRFFTDENRSTVAHNSKYDSQIIHEEFGYPISNIRFDSMLGSFQLDSNQPCNLEACVMREIPENGGYKTDFWSRVTEAEKSSGEWWKKYELEEVLYYGIEDTANCFELTKIYSKRLENE